MISCKILIFSAIFIKVYKDQSIYLIVRTIITWLCRIDLNLYMPLVVDASTRKFIPLPMYVLDASTNDDEDDDVVLITAIIVMTMIMSSSLAEVVVAMMTLLS